MSTIKVYTAERSKQIEDSTVVSGSVNSMGNLILLTRAGTQIDAGDVKGDQGDPGIQGNPGIPGGTPAQRDALFGVPSTTAAQVALANKSVTWFNITTGWFELYQATTGSAGLNVPGVSGAAGWYQIGGPNYLKLAEGIKLQKQFNTNVTIPASGDFVAASAPSFAFKANRNYEIEFEWSQANGNSNTYWLWRFGIAPITDAASLTTNTITVGVPRTKRGSTSSSAESYRIKGLYQPTTDVSKQIKLLVTNVMGGGTGTLLGQNEPAILTIRDVGANTIQTS